MQSAEADDACLHPGILPPAQGWAGAGLMSRDREREEGPELAWGTKGANSLGKAGRADPLSRACLLGNRSHSWFPILSDHFLLLKILIYLISLKGKDKEPGEPSRKGENLRAAPVA